MLHVDQRSDRRVRFSSEARKLDIGSVALAACVLGRSLAAGGNRLERSPEPGDGPLGRLEPRRVLRVVEGERRRRRPRCARIDGRSTVDIDLAWRHVAPEGLRATPKHARNHGADDDHHHQHHRPTDDRADTHAVSAAHRGRY